MLDVDPDTDGDGEISDLENQLDSRFDKSDNRILGEVRPGIHSFDTLGDAGYESFGVPSQGVSTTGNILRSRKAKPESVQLLKRDLGYISMLTETLTRTIISLYL